jgi:hypothetical protein
VKKNTGRPNLKAIRDAMASFELSPKVEPNEVIGLDRAFFPDGHRGVLDLKRQLVVGNRGMGKSFWTHALQSADIRKRVASIYKVPGLAKSHVRIGFNGSERIGAVAPTIEEISRFRERADIVWRAVLVRAARSVVDENPQQISFAETVNQITKRPELYAQVMTEVDDHLLSKGENLIIVFDALDRLSDDGWDRIRDLSKSLLVRALGLQSFRCIRTKIFMRVDQFTDAELFRFPDSSKIKNDAVSLSWRPHELFDLLFFQLRRDSTASKPFKEMVANITGQDPDDVRLVLHDEERAQIVTALGGEFMGGHKKRGRVYTWVPLHLSDADNNCSPRTFLTAWKSAAEHPPAPLHLVVDHLGLIDGVRRASSVRLTELREDYPWIDTALEPLRRQFVPMDKDDLFALWNDSGVMSKILRDAKRNRWLAPIGVLDERTISALLEAMVTIAVMEERSNAKINVPDIFRVQAEILRKGGVAVPKRK